jgi:hypothetical protein
MSKRIKLNKIRREKLIKETEFKIFQRSVYQGIEAIRQQGIKFAPYKGLSAGACPIQPPPAIQTYANTYIGSNTASRPGVEGTV